MNNIFTLHQSILSDYKSYINSFLNIADKRILDVVNKDFELRTLYPEPLIQFNPAFESGGKVEDLINKNILVKEFNNIFYDDAGKSWLIYKHQEESIIVGNEGKGFVVTSGTGSGKSLTYISTILNYLFKNPDKKGVKAIIVYPLNALINSQEIALKQFADNYEKRTGYSFPFTFGKYTGQENKEKREMLKANKPDILLTNYMMLELLMVRKDDADLRNSFLENMQYLVYDELHVYKGRQGADVSLLNRRIKAAATNKNIICIGTSATMTSGSVEEQKKIVAGVATNFFDSKFNPDQVIIESLTYSTKDIIPNSDALKKAVENSMLSGPLELLLNNPIAIWLERTIAIKEDGPNKIRNKPQSLNETAKQLSEVIKIPINICEQRIIETLIWAESINIESIAAKKKDSVLPFKIHQFISQTGYVYVTLQKPDKRYITLNPNPTVKISETEKEIPVFQTVFSRVSGEEFICVRKVESKDESTKFIFRDFNENHNPRNEEDLKYNNGIKVKKRKREQHEYRDGYLIFDKGYLLNINDYLDILPSAWLTKAGDIIEAKEMFLPKEIYVSKDGSFSETPGFGEKGWFIPAPLIYDPTCGLIYQETQLSEKSKLISLGNEGRSTSTTIITLQTLLALHKHGKPLKEQKLMSFTDNRQDASLQAGHFNDFIQVVHMRSAIEKVVSNNNVPVTISELIFKTQEVLNLPESEYALYPSPNPNRPNEDNIAALRNYLAYRIIQDLKRGWRYILPNLEQTALLQISYKDIDKHCADESLWSTIELLSLWTPEDRKEFIIQILNYFRNMYAVDYDMLRYENRKRQEDELNQQLNKDKLWSLDKGEKIEAPVFLSIQGRDKATRETYIESIGVQSRLARYIKHEFRKAGLDQPRTEVYNDFMTKILDLLSDDTHYLRKQPVHADKGDKTIFQLDLSKVLWSSGDLINVEIDKTAYISVDQEKNIVIQPHLYFQKLYQQDFSKLDKSYIAAEHTGQISNEDKIIREEKFNEAKELSALYCSPTLELGIDISSLNIVHMRNVPPSPANYAQRSGRAGRSGQSALVFTYASKVSPHDKHYFSDPVKMVSGIVQAPRIDLSNEELLRSHINATVVSFLNAEEFTPSIETLIDFNNNAFGLKLDIKDKYQEIIDTRFDEIKSLVLRILSNIPLTDSKWYNLKWVDNQIKTVPGKLELALNRWTKMFIDARRQMNEAHEIKSSPIIKDPELKKIADRSYWLAENRLKLLLNSDKNKNSTLSEFYTFRYLAAEGFLPGYGFTRLPIRVFLGGKDRNEVISRSRFIGLKEFGPNNMIYHNGGKFKVNRVTPSDVEFNLSTIKISKDTNYAYLNDEGKGINADPITGKSFDASNLEIYNKRLLALEEAQSENKERISCMEEVRTSEGYVTDLYFNTIDGLADATKIKLTVDEKELMQLFYAPSAKLIMLNKKWKRSQNDGFEIGIKTGFFKTQKQTEKGNTDDTAINVMFYTYDTSDVLYLQPIKSLNLTEEGVITMQYALRKAIEQHYNIEAVEITAKLMGSNVNKNIMLYESVEGSIGVLKDISKNPATLNIIFQKAYEIIGYDYITKTDKYPERTKASYDDLLSYYNQTDHININRHSIKNALELLITSKPDDTRGSTYEEKFQYLMDRIHSKSPGEKKLLEYLFINGYKLPDHTNYNLEQFYTQPDFVYEKDRVLIYVDGGIHKNAVIKANDDKIRRTLTLAGFDVLVWDDTTETIESFVAKRQDIFRKVR